MSALEMHIVQQFDFLLRARERKAGARMQDKREHQRRGQPDLEVGPEAGPDDRHDEERASDSGAEQHRRTVSRALLA